MFEGIALESRFSKFDVFVIMTLGLETFFVVEFDDKYIINKQFKG